jgi:hypothetical protein
LSLGISNRSQYPDDVAARKKSTWGGARPGAGRKAILQKPVRVTFDLEESDLDALKASADRRGLSVAETLRKAVQVYLRRQGRR